VVKIHRIQSTAVNTIVNSKKVSVTVAPVPFSVPDNFVPELDGSTRPRSIGFVGGLHPERGTSEFVNLIKRLPVSQMDLDIYVVGEGNDRAKMEEAEFIFSATSAARNLSRLGRK
jgi:glycosyltransferase involved in cell wall biosynthesis